jgi:toxin ParE1/3/4
MPDARMSRPALRDLDEIWLYIAQDSVAAAERLVDEIEAAAHMLAQFPGAGQRREDLRAGMLSFPVRQDLIFCRRQKRGIEVLHVYHGARHLQELF